MQRWALLAIAIQTSSSATLFLTRQGPPLVGIFSAQVPWKVLAETAISAMCKFTPQELDEKSWSISQKGLNTFQGRRLLLNSCILDWNQYLTSDEHWAVLAHIITEEMLALTALVLVGSTHTHVAFFFHIECLFCCYNLIVHRVEEQQTHIFLWNYKHKHRSSVLLGMEAVILSFLQAGFVLDTDRFFWMMVIGKNFAKV